MARDGGEVVLSPFDIVDTLYASNKEMLFEHLDQRRNYHLSFVTTEAQSKDLQAIFEADHAEPERHRLGRPWLNHTSGERVVLASRLSDSNATQGIAVFDRKTSIQMVERDLILKYQIELSNFYVAPTARVNGIAYSLATAIALEIAHDVGCLRTAIYKADRIYRDKVKLEFEIGGEPYTTGGARIARQVVESMRDAIEHTFQSEEIERFCDGEVLEEDFTLMYTFFDEIGDPPEKLDYTVIGDGLNDEANPSPGP